MEKENDMPISNRGEPPAALKGFPPAKTFQVCAETYAEESTPSILDLIEQCQNEIPASRRGESSNEAIGLEVLHDVTVQGDHAARTAVQHYFSEFVRDRLHRHPQRESATQLESEETYVDLTFERFWQATIQQKITYRTLGGALLGLHASLHGAILDTLRTNSWPGEVARSVSCEAGELPAEDHAASLIWKLLHTILPSDRERRLAYLLFHCDLSPKDIVNSFPQEFQDVHEISRLRCFIFERLLHEMPHFPDGQ